MDAENSQSEDTSTGKLDKLIERWTSRKLLVWLTTTGLLLSGLVTSDEWLAIALGYIGIQGVADIAVKWKSAGKNSNVGSLN
jgi:hypothetical protein